MRIRVLALTFTCFVFPATPQRIITTVAGADWYLTADGRQAKDVPLSTEVLRVAVDAQGNTYIPDVLNQVVFRVGRDGITRIVAGNGIGAYSGDGGPATSASLNLPTGVALDAGGNLFIADAANFRIRKVAPDGTISTFAGNGVFTYGGDGGPALAASFGVLAALSFDGAGNMLVCDSSNNRVRRITPAGIVTTIAGNGRADYTGDGAAATQAALNDPEAAVVDSTGRIFIADFGNNAVRMVTNGTISTFAGNRNGGFGGDGGQARSASFTSPAGLVFDPAGNLYVADSNNNRIRMIAPSGIVNTIAGTGAGDFTGDGGLPVRATLSLPFGLAWDAGRLLVADRGNSRVRAIIPGNSVQTLAGNGLYRYTPDGTAASRSFLFEPSGVALNTSGNLFIADTNNNVVRRLAAGGIVQKVAGVGVSALGPDGAPATSAGIAFPHGIAFAPNGDLAIADLGNNLIQRITADGTIHAVAGNGNQGFGGDGGPATRAMLNLPNAVAFDNAGNMYIADTGNNRVRKVSGSVITTLAGNGAFASSGDGQLAVNASIAVAGGVAVDVGGSVYIADYYGYRIRKVTPDGRITTIAGTGRSGGDGDGGPALNANLNNPYQLAFDNQGNLYFSEVPGKVRVISANGIISTVAGNGQAGFYGDGGPATAAAINTPNGIAIASDGTVYIADVLNNRVRAVVAASPLLSVSTRQLSFDVTSGGSPSAQQTVTLASSLQGAAFNGLPFAIAATTASGGLWLQTSPLSGSVPSVAGITVDPANLAPGTYQGTVQISAAGANPPVVAVQVTANVTDSRPPKISASSSQMNLSVSSGAPAVSQTLPVSNVGGGVLNVTIAASGGSWLTVSVGSASITPASPLSLVVSANPAGLDAGTYSGAVVISSDQDPVSVPVVLTVIRSQPVLLLSQTGVSFTTVQGGSAPLPQTVGIINTGQGAMNWTATRKTLAGGPWLSISAAGGTVTAPNTDVSLLRLSVDASGMQAGTYYGQVQVNVANADNSPRFVTVVLTVLDPGTTPGPEINSRGLIFTGAAGSSPGSQEILISNPASTPLSFVSSATTVPAGGTWLAYLPSGATINPGQPLKIVIQADLSKLAAGTQQASISFQFSDGSIGAVNILAVVAPQGAGVASGKNGVREAAGCSPQGLTVQPAAPSDLFSAPIQQPLTLQVRVTDTCGTAFTTSGIVSARFSNGDNVVYLNHTGNGNWSGNWSPRNAAPPSVQIAFTAIGTAPALAGQARINGTLRSGSTPPLTLRLTNAANGSASTSAFVPPGGLVSIFGDQLAASTEEHGDAPFPFDIAGTQVLLGGKPLPLRYVSGNQINAQIPFELTSTTTHQLVVQRGAALSIPQEVVVAVSEPAIYTVDQSGSGAAVVKNADRDNAYVTPDAPAAAGDHVIIYCNGLGAIDPPVPSGTIAPVDGPRSKARAAVSLTIGGVPAQIDFAGMSPGTADLFEIDTAIPPGAGSGDGIQILLTVAGHTSPPVTISLR